MKSQFLNIIIAIEKKTHTKWVVHVFPLRGYSIWIILLVLSRRFWIGLYCYISFCDVAFLQSTILIYSFQFRRWRQWTYYTAPPLHSCLSSHCCHLVSFVEFRFYLIRNGFCLFFDVYFFFAAHQVECQQQKAVLTISTHDAAVVVTERELFTIQLKYIL